MNLRLRPLARTNLLAVVVASALASSLALGCAPRASAPPASAARTATTSATRIAEAPPRVYRLDFVLKATDAAGQPKSTAFTMNLAEGNVGEVVVGDNVELPSAAPPGGSPGAARVGGPRQDVGLKVKARLRHDAAAAVLLDVTTEMSAVEGSSSVHKMVTRSDALAKEGASALVGTVDRPGQHYELTVTPTKLR